MIFHKEIVCDTKQTFGSTDYSSEGGSITETKFQLCNFGGISALADALQKEAGQSGCNVLLALALKNACRAVVSVKSLLYAELRAAMALLASQGVGIFDKFHYVVNDAGNITLVPKNRWNKFDGTHVLAWKALGHWSGLKRSSDLLSAIITPGGLPISDWQSGIFSQASFRVVGSTWLKRWGLDIQQCADDQKLRNQSSYRPSRLIPTEYLLTDERARFVKEFWRLCKPSGAELFQRLDRHLLRMWVREQYVAIKGGIANSGNPNFVEAMSKLTDN